MAALSTIIFPLKSTGQALVLAAVLAASSLVTAETTSAEWEKEAMRKYPELARAGSELNKKFTDAVTAARVSRPQLFNDPKWPLIIAEEVHTMAIAPPPATPGSDPLLLGGKRVATARVLAEASTKKLEEAVKTRNVAQITAACQQFAHESAILRAQAKALGQTLGEATREIAAAEQFSRQSQPEVARLRRNAMIAGTPSALSPNDPVKSQHAAELQASADALQGKIEQRTARAKEALEDCLQGFQALILKAREDSADPLPPTNPTPL